MESTQQSDRESYRGLAAGQGRSESPPARFLLLLEAYLTLIRFDLYLARGDFESLHQKVQNCPTRKKPCAPDSTEVICGAVDMACIWYWKEVLCLQRSAATTCLLRKYGIPAHLVIGTQQMPFKAHAWVEVDGRVVNDKQYLRELYARLDQC